MIDHLSYETLGGLFQELSDEEFLSLLRHTLDDPFPYRLSLLPPKKEWNQQEKILSTPFNHRLRQFINADQSSCDLSACLFPLEVDLKDYHCEVPLTCSKSHFYQKAAFSNSLFFHFVDFSYSEFFSIADFSNAICNGSITLANVVFHDKALFAKTTFYHWITFQHTKFLANTLFAGATFASDATFSHTVFSSKADFSYASFNKAYFQQAAFANDATFSHTTFNLSSFAKAVFAAKADFSFTSFTQKAHFPNFSCNGPLSFSNATFYKEVTFSNSTFFSTEFLHATFTAKTNFSKAIFTARSAFSHSLFSDRANFSSATFLQRATFSSTHFARSAFFSKTAFSRSVFFSQAHFGDTVDFSSSKFYGFASFSQIECLGVVNFPHSVFCDWADFANALFHRHANFSDVVFGDDVSFANVQIIEDLDFSRVRFQGKSNPNFMNCFGVSREIAALFTFKQARFSLYYPPLFHNTHLHQGCSFFETSFIRPKTLLWMQLAYLIRRLGRKTVPRRLKRAFALLKARQKLQKSISNETLSIASNAYRTLRLSMEINRAREEESLFFGYQLWTNRQISTTYRYIKLLDWFYSTFADYGQSIIKPLLGLAGVLAVFSFIFNKVFSVNGWDTAIQQLVRPFFDLCLHQKGWICFAGVWESILAYTFLTLFIIGVRRRFRKN